MDQESFDFGEADRRRRRYRRRRWLPAPKTSAETLPLADAPVVQICGRCGLQQTLLAETALCANCGAIIVRKERGEDEASWVEPTPPPASTEAEEE